MCFRYLEQGNIIEAYSNKFYINHSTFKLKVTKLMGDAQKKKFRFFQRATHAQVEFIKNTSVRDKRAPFMILKVQDEMHKEFQQADFRNQMDLKFQEHELQVHALLRFNPATFFV